MTGVQTCALPILLKREQRGMQQAGEEMLREFFSREGVEYTPENIRKICNLHTIKTQEELFAAIGLKTIILGENDKNELKDKPTSSNWKKYISFAFGGSKTNKEKPTEEKEPLQKIDSKKILKLTPEAIQKNYVIAECCKPRSEERRVGKECRIGCRSRWSPYH